MSSDNSSNSKGWYKHTGYDESQELYGKILSIVARHANDDNISAILDGEAINGEGAADKIKRAKRQLFGILLGEVANQDLAVYLTKNHAGDGKAAVDYVMGCFSAGDDVLKLKAVDKDYKKIERDGLPVGGNVDECNKIAHLQRRRLWPMRCPTSVTCAT